MASLTVWRDPWTRPFRELSRMQSAFDKMFSDLTEKKLMGTDLEGRFAPSCEVSEDEKNYLMKFDLPGISKDQVKIEMSDGQLTVTAERREEKKTDNKKTYVSEISYGSYMRSFTLPPNVDDKKVDAKFENGVLSITIPKSEPSSSKKIEVH